MNVEEHLSQEKNNLGIKMSHTVSSTELCESEFKSDSWIYPFIKLSLGFYRCTVTQILIKCAQFQKCPKVVRYSYKTTH